MDNFDFLYEKKKNKEELIPLYKELDIPYRKNIDSNDQVNQSENSKIIIIELL